MHSTPEVPSPVAVQHAPMGFVPCTNWSAGMQAGEGDGGKHQPKSPASSQVQVNPVTMPSQGDWSPSHSSSHMALPEPRFAQNLSRQSVSAVQQ